VQEPSVAAFAEIPIRDHARRGDRAAAALHEKALAALDELIPATSWAAENEDN